MNNKAIVLIGFMGVGKTTIGKELATKLSWDFVDVDEEIENSFNMSTVDIFRIHGENKFRQKEKEIILKLVTQNNIVISVGGGAFKQSIIKQVCMEQSTVISLNLAWDYWKDRVSMLVDTRPILQGKTLEEMKELYDERQVIYKDCHIRTELEGRAVSIIVDEITDELTKL